MRRSFSWNVQQYTFFRKPQEVPQSLRASTKKFLESASSKSLFIIFRCYRSPQLFFFWSVKEQNFLKNCLHTIILFYNMHERNSREQWRKRLIIVNLWILVSDNFFSMLRLLVFLLHKCLTLLSIWWIGMVWIFNFEKCEEKISIMFKLKSFSIPSCEFQRILMKAEIFMIFDNKYLKKLSFLNKFSFLMIDKYDNYSFTINKSCLIVSLKKIFLFHLV